MKATARPTLPARLDFFDNLRYLMVLLVLVFHSGASYGSIVRFWPYHDPHPLEVVDILMMVLDVFIMSILFFIAGYFAAPSLEKRGAAEFLREKFRYLGIPWLAITVLVLPVLDYVHYRTQVMPRGGVPRPYGMHWWLSMKRILAFEVGPMRMSEYLDMSVHFYQRYVWFLSLLLVFFVMLVLVRDVYRRLRPGEESGGPGKAAPSSKSAAGALAFTALINIILFGLFKALNASLDQPFNMGWFSLGNLVQFESAKLAFYAPYFGLGVFAWSRRWFAGGGDVGRPGPWVWTCLGLMVANMLVGRGLSRLIEPPTWLQLAFLVLYPLWTFSFLGVFTSLAARRWNRARPIDRVLAANSFNMYLVHYVFVLLLPLLLGGWATAPTLLKFCTVAAITILLSYGISRYVIRPAPRLVLAGLLGVNVLLGMSS